MVKLEKCRNFQEKRYSSEYMSFAIMILLVLGFNESTRYLVGKVQICTGGPVMNRKHFSCNVNIDIHNSNPIWVWL